MNSAMRPIFNEIFGEKRDLWISWTVYGTHKPDRNALIKKKRKKEKKESQNVDVEMQILSKHILSLRDSL